MRVRETLRILGGSILVYVVVATCGKAGTSTAVRDGGTVDVSAPGGFDVSVPGGLDVSRVVDLLTNPVPDARADLPQSGSRLKAMYYVGADGSKQPRLNLWYDSQRGENCGFSTAADGTLRCLPGGGSVGIYFADAGCAQPLVLAQAGPGCTVPTTASAETVTSCPSGVTFTIYQVGPSFTGSPYSGTPSSCSKVTTTLPGYAIYSLGAEIPPSSFVSATVQTGQ